MPLTEKLGLIFEVGLVAVSGVGEPHVLVSGSVVSETVDIALAVRD